MSRRDAAWATALAEHAQVVDDYAARMRAVTSERWAVSVVDGKWSPAVEALHVQMAYELGAAVCEQDGSPGMRLRTSPLMAWVLRTFMLPVMLATRTFPRDAPAPRELRPDADAAMLPADEREVRLRAAALRAAQSLRAAEGRQPPVHFQHAYFGRLAPLSALRLLSAHTRHHTRVGLARLDRPFLDRGAA